MSPISHYTHPAAREFILKCPKFEPCWLKFDNHGARPCDYFLDYHLEQYPIPDEWFVEAKLPNFLCRAILNTGLCNITNANLSGNLKTGDRIKLAMTILYLKYMSLKQKIDDDSSVTDEQSLDISIVVQWDDFYSDRIIVEKLHQSSQQFSHPIERAKSDVEMILDSPNYHAFVRKIIMSDLVHKD